MGSFGSPDTARNYVSGLSTFYSWIGRDLVAFRAPMVSQMLKAVQLTIRPPLKVQYVLDLATLKQLLFHAKILGANAAVFRALLTLLFFTMVRISTFLPQLETGFDFTRNLTKADVVLHTDFLLFRVKWAKNVQTRAMATPSAFIVSIINYY